MTNPFAAPPTATVAAPITSPFAAPPTAQPVTASNGEDPFSAPAPQRPRGPRVLDMYGRLLLIRPLSVERVSAQNKERPDEMKDRMTADVIVLDGGPIAFGGAPEKLPPVPHDRIADVPLKIDSMFISNKGLVSQCRDALEKRRRNESGAIVLGRLGVGQARSADQSPPYLLSVANDAEKAIARAYLAQVDPFA